MGSFLVIMILNWAARSQPDSQMAFAQTPDRPPEKLDRGFADLVKRVGGAVVNISTFARPKFPSRRGPVNPMDPNDPFRNFFEEFFGGRMPRPDRDSEMEPKSQKPVPFALGTGFIIDESGLILTNHHVIGGAEEVKIQFSEDDDFTPAEIIGRDPELDVALLSVKTKQKLTPIPLGDSDRIEVGEYVLAIGNPLGYGHSVTHGILSAKERKAPELKLAKYLQTDASINPGNSGGPLINMKGEVVGINNAIDARGQGIGFAISINSVKQVLNQLKTKGTVSRGYLGIGVGELNEELSGQLKLPKGTKGVLVAEVIPGQAADQAGLEPYDVITKVNQDSVATPLDLTTKITSIKVGDSTELTYYRKGKEKKIKIQVGERPSPKLSDSEKGGSATPKKKGKASSLLQDWGFQATELNPENGQELGIPETFARQGKHIVVFDIAYGKPAAESGLNRGDVILDVGGRETQSLKQLEEVMKGLQGKTVMIRVKRFAPNGESAAVVILLKPSAP
jgi:serine protease Do